MQGTDILRIDDECYGSLHRHPLWGGEEIEPGDDTETVLIDDVGSQGVVMRALYFLARECHGVEATTPEADGGFGNMPADALPWEFWAFSAMWALAAQVILILLLNDVVNEQENRNSSAPAAFYVIAVLVVHMYSMCTYFTGPFLKQMYLLSHINFDGSVSPIRSKIIAYLLVLFDVGIASAILLYGIVFLINSGSSGDLLLNAVALSFILDVDDYLAKLTPNAGAAAEVEVPKCVVLPKYNPAWSETSMQVAMFLIGGWIATPVIPVGAAIVAFYWRTKLHSPGILEVTNATMANVTSH